MKKLVKVEEVEGEGLLGLLGKRVLLMCAAYFYHGTLIGVNEDCVLFDDCAIVYDTGPWSEKKYADSQVVGDGHYVMRQAIESFREDNRR